MGLEPSAFEPPTLKVADDWTVTYATAGPTITTDTDAVYRLASTTPSTPTGGTTSLNHTPAGWQRTAPSATTTQAVYRSQRTRTYMDGAFTSATTWGTPSIFANRLLTLAEYDDTGLEVVAAALLVATADALPIPSDLYADSDRGGTGVPLDGELGLGPDNTVISRIRYADVGGETRLVLNDNNNPVTFDIGAYLGASGDGNDLTMTIQTHRGRSGIACVYGNCFRWSQLRTMDAHALRSRPLSTPS